MESVLLTIAVLACPVGMGLMMWFMGPGRSSGAGIGAGSGTEEDRAAQVEQLRAEIDQLKAERAAKRVEETT